MRSCVRCGIDFAAGERLMTRDTVAGDSPRCSARNFRLTDGAEASPRGREGATVFDRGIGVFRVRSFAQQGLRRQAGMRNFLLVKQRYSGTLRAKNSRKIDLSWTGPSTIYFAFFRTFLLTGPRRRVFYARSGVR